jgi:hypothetical protein
LDRLGQTTGDTSTPDRESLLDACGRKATPLMFFQWFNLEDPDGNRVLVVQP